MKIIITGGTGFLGKRLSRKLRKKWTRNYELRYYRWI